MHARKKCGRTCSAPAAQACLRVRQRQTKGWQRWSTASHPEQHAQHQQQSEQQGAAERAELPAAARDVALAAQRDADDADDGRASCVQARLLVASVWRQIQRITRHQQRRQLQLAPSALCFRRRAAHGAGCRGARRARGASRVSRRCVQSWRMGVAPACLLRGSVPAALPACPGGEW
jgi:hypothetical protein